MASNDELAHLVVKIACYYGGEISLEKLWAELQSNGCKLPNQNALSKLLEKYPNNFKIVRGAGMLVRIFTNLGLCADHCMKHGECHLPAAQCGGLHICKFFLLSDSCQFKNCAYLHDFTSEHNTKLLKENFLDPDDLSDAQLKMVFRKMESRNPLTVPQLCKFYNNAGGCSKNPCICLHLCAHFVLGTCKFGGRCKRNHDILFQPVLDLLDRYGIEMYLPEHVILEALRVHSGRPLGTVQAPVMRRHESLPSLFQCSVLSTFPNQPTAPLLSSQRSNDAGRPSRYRQPRSSSQYRRQPSPAVPFHQQSTPTIPFQQQPSYQRGASSTRDSMSSASPGLFSRQWSSSSVSSNSSDMGCKESTEICIYFLRGKCLFSENCKNHHKKMIYQWQFRPSNVTTWCDFDDENNQTLEKNYSQVDISECYISVCSKEVIRIDFDTMLGTGKKTSMVIHRLSTLSSVSPNAPFSIQEWLTVWHWYWKEEEEKWKEYGEEDSAGLKSALTSTSLEKKFLENPCDKFPFQTNGHEYVLSFKKMIQKNIKYKTKREVRRRPEFFRPEDIKKRAVMKTLAWSGSSVNFPESWDLSSCSSEEDLS